MSKPGSGLRNSRQWLGRTFGSGFDELTFYALSTWRRWQRHTYHLSNAAEMLALHELTQAEPTQLFVPPPLPDVSIQNQKMPTVLRPLARNYRYTQLAFPSAITTGNPTNDMVHAHHLYRPDHKNGPTLLYLHGWHNFNAALSLFTPLQLVAPLGYNLVMLELPHHIGRTAAGTYSGELSLTANLPATLITMQQAVSDTRAMAGWLRARGIERLAIEGQSLGGLVAALTLTVEAAFDCAVLFVPAVEPGTSLWHSTYTRTLRRELLRQGLDESATGALLESLRPARSRPLLEPERILVVAATGDRVAFRPDVENFARAWGANFAAIEWGHLSSHRLSPAFRLIRPFLGRWLGAGGIN